MVGQMICEADRSQVEEDEPISPRRLQYAGKISWRSWCAWKATAAKRSA